MYIAIIADNNKKELMTQFCIAYSGILCHHNLCATHTTGKSISEATGLEIETVLTGSAGGTEQIASMISFNEIDAVFYFRSTDPADVVYEGEANLLRLCDVHNVPLATNIATAEVMRMGRTLISRNRFFFLILKNKKYPRMVIAAEKIPIYGINLPTISYISFSSKFPPMIASGERTVAATVMTVVRAD